MNTKKLDIGKVYFLYLFMVLFLQIIGLNSKGQSLDTIWKAGVIGITMLYVFAKSKTRIEIYLLVPYFIYFLGQLAAYFIYPNTIASPANTTVVINVAIISSMVYLFLSYPYSCGGFTISDLGWFLNAFIGLMLYAVVNNFIKNPMAVLGALSNENVYSNMMSSFFDNKQTFGMFLMMAVICSAMQYARTLKKIYAIIMLIFLANLFVCLSRTALLACFVFLILSAVLLVNKQIKYTGFVLLIFAVFTILILTIPQLKIFIENVVFDTDKTVNARQDIWKSAFDMLKGKQFVFGYGEGTSGIVLGESSSISKYSHNGIVQVLLTGGLIKLVLYVLSICKCLSSIRSIRRYQPVLAAIFLSALSGILVYSMGEAIVLFDTSAPCVAATIICAGLPSALESYLKQKHT